MSEEKCPNCGRINPRQQMVCKCGYNFRTGEIESPPSLDSNLVKSGCVIAFVLIGLAILVIIILAIIVFNSIQNHML